MLAGRWYHHGAGKEEENSNEASCVVALHLDAETSLAPVPSLSVVTAESCLSVHTFALPYKMPPRCTKRPCALRCVSRDMLHSGEMIVPDGVVRSEANPLGNGAVLLLRLGELLLRAERLVALFARKSVMSALWSRHRPGCKLPISSRVPRNSSSSSPLTRVYRSHSRILQSVDTYRHFD